MLRASGAGAMLAGTAWLATSPAWAAKAGTTQTVIIENVQFMPSAITVHRGDRVVWKNQDLFPHTVTGAGNALSSGTIAPHQAWRFVAGKPGVYPYLCDFHPTMKGTLTVLK